MTRLSDALDRANDFNPAAVRRDMPPAAWDFSDPDDEPLEPARAPAEEPHPVAEAPHTAAEAPHPVTQAPHLVAQAPHPVAQPPYVADTPRTFAEPYRSLESRFSAEDRAKVVVGRDTESSVI